MSGDLIVFIIGAVVFAMTVYGTVMAGGIALSRRSIAEDPMLRAEVDEDALDKAIPLDVKY